MSADFPAAKWRKSSRSNSEQACVEVAQLPAAIAIRDSKNPEGASLTIARREFAALINQVKASDLDL